MSTTVLVLLSFPVVATWLAPIAVAAAALVAEAVARLADRRHRVHARQLQAGSRA